MQLTVWHKSKALAVLVYRATDTFPNSERFGLVHQTRRAAVSISANIAEGCGRRSHRDMARFLDIALGSAYELASHIELGADLGFITSPAKRELIGRTSEVRRMLVGLRRSVSR